MNTERLFELDFQRKAEICLQAFQLSSVNLKLDMDFHMVSLRQIYMFLEQIYWENGLKYFLLIIRLNQWIRRLEIKCKVELKEADQRTFSIKLLECR